MSHALQVHLDEPEFETLQTWARARGWSLSQAVRVALRALTRPHSEDPLLAACGMIEGLPVDFSQRINHYLNLTFVAEPVSPNSYEKPKRRAKKPVRR